MVTAPSPEMLLVTLLFAGMGWVQNEYIQPKHAIAYKCSLSLSIGRTDTFRIYKYPKDHSYFCPPHCAVDHHHFVHLRDKCTSTTCNHMVIERVVRYMKREEYIKGDGIKRRSTSSPTIRPSPKPGDRDL